MKNTKITGYKVIAEYGIYQHEVMPADTVAQAFKYLKECKELGAEYITIKMCTHTRKLFRTEYDETVVHEWSNEEE